MNSDAESDEEREALRKRLKLCAQKVGTADELSRLTGITRSTLSNYLSGRNDPKSSAIAQIARVAEVSADWLLGLEDEPDRKPVKAASNECLEPELVKQVVYQLSVYLRREKLWRDTHPEDMSKITMIVCSLIKDELSDEKKPVVIERYSEIIKVILDHLN